MFGSWVGKIRWRRDRPPTPVFLVFPCGSAGKESSCNVGDLGSTPGWEDPLEKGQATHSSILAWRIPWNIVKDADLSHQKCGVTCSHGGCQLTLEGARTAPLYAS